MPTTAWRFAGTEGADDAVLRLKQLDAADLINVMGARGHAAATKSIGMGSQDGRCRYS